MKRLLLVMTVLWGGGAFGYWYYNDARSQRVSFRTVKVVRGDLLATINATGTLEPEEVVDVGAQIAGEIQSFGPDPRDPSRPISYGSPVDQGTVLARIADALFKARVDQMDANLQHAEAEVLQAQARLRQTNRELDRSKKLMGKGQVSATDHDTATANHETAIASLELSQSAVKLARANLDEAKVNLAYTTIKSPVKGVILDRRVNIGQTVVASLNAPSLFLIAKDLSRMEIWASVNETDIGAIHEGQGVAFTVASSPNETFHGRVKQVRLNASMTQSVVTYTVVVEVDNSGGKLLPYLTARLEFEVERRTQALLVPNAALRWKPKLALVAPGYREEYSRPRRATDASNRQGSRAGSGQPDHEAVLWVRAGEFVRPVEARVGLSDGVRTEVAAGGDLIEGTNVVVGVTQGGEDESDATASPFLPKLKNEKAKK